MNEDKLNSHLICIQGNSETFGVPILPSLMLALQRLNSTRKINFYEQKVTKSQNTQKIH